MAPKATKRQSVTPAEGAAKKRSTLNHDIKEVCRALENSDLPEAAVETLASCGTYCLSSYEAERHPYEATVVEMMEEALAGVEVKLQKAAQEAEAVLANFDLAKLEASIPTAAYFLAAKEGAEANAEAEVCICKFNAQKTAAALKAAQQMQKAGDAELEPVERTKVDLQSVKTDALGRWRSSEPTKKEVAVLEKMLKKCGLDPSLLSSMEAAFCKDVAARTSFDSTVLHSLEALLTEKVKELEEQLAKGAPEKAERAKVVEAAMAAHDHALADEDAANKAHESASQETRAAKKALADAEHAVRDFAKEKKRVEKVAEAAAKKVEDFKNGPLRTLQELKHRSRPPPPTEGDASGEVVETAQEPPQQA